MFESQALVISDAAGSGSGVWVGEAFATFGLVLAILQLVYQGRNLWISAAVGLWLAVGHTLTSSTSFANPAVSIGRMFTDARAVVASSSALWFLVFQILGALLAWRASQAPAATPNNDLLAVCWHQAAVTEGSSALSSSGNLHKNSYLQETGKTQLARFRPTARHIRSPVWGGEIEKSFFVADGSPFEKLLVGFAGARELPERCRILRNASPNSHAEKGSQQ
jgi:hypothetical protein